MTSVCGCKFAEWRTRDGVVVEMCVEQCGQVRLEYQLLDDPFPDAGDAWWRPRATRLARQVRQVLDARDPEVNEFQRRVVASRGGGAAGVLDRVNSLLGRGVTAAAEKLAHRAWKSVAELSDHVGETLPFPPEMVSFSTGSSVRPEPLPMVSVWKADAGDLKLRSIRPEDRDEFWRGRLAAIKEYVCKNHSAQNP